MGNLVLTNEDTYSGSLILVTPDIPLQTFPEMSDLQPVPDRQGRRAGFGDTVWIRKQAAAALKELLADVGCKDEITAVSGFRTQREQREIWDDSMAKNGEIFTRKFVAVPGHSEHQSGYAVDLAENAKEIDFICPNFPRSGIFQKFRERMPYFGFIERYPSGKEKITGIGAEPWHFRYVGYPHSVIMADRGMTLEEYIELLKNDTAWGRPYIFRDGGNWVEISCISLAQKSETVLELPEAAGYQVSGTNEGCAVVCLWRKTA